DAQRVGIGFSAAALQRSEQRIAACRRRLWLLLRRSRCCDRGGASTSLCRCRGWDPTDSTITAAAGKPPLRAKSSLRAAGSKPVPKSTTRVRHALPPRLRTRGLCRNISRRKRLLQHVGYVFSVTILQIVDAPAPDRLLPGAVNQRINATRLV